MVSEKADLQLSEDSVGGKTIFLSLGNEPEYLQGMDKFTGLLTEKNIPGLEWKYVNYKNDTHGSVPHKTIYEGLELIFSGWQLGIEDANDLSSIQSHYQRLSDKFGFRVKPPEFLINRLGYQFLGKNEHAQAIEVFLVNLDLYPESDNVYDSLGEAYEKSGQLKLAAENYQIAVEKGEKVTSRNLPVYKNNLARVRATLK